MKRSKNLVWIFLFAGLFSDSSFGQTNATSPDGFINTVDGRVNAKDYQRAKEAALAESKKEYEEMIRHPELITNRPSSEWPFPNFEAGPGRPRPNYVNFYTMDDRFPSYLLCEYAIKEDRYDQSREPGWFKESLEQIRQSGPTNFPPINWVAVAIRDVSEHKDASTFEQSFKVGSIFNTTNVFDSSNDLSKLVAAAGIDRHPFKYDTNIPISGVQQRWMIVERHAATNNPTTGPK